MKKERNSNIELLRILAMALIIAHHSVVHGGLKVMGDSGINNLFILFMGMGGKLGVDVFILITGFFGVGRKFKIGKVMSVDGSCWFYGIVCGAIALLSSTAVLSTIKLTKVVFPIWNNLYWFMTCYVILYCLSGYINKMVENITRKKHALLIVMLLVMNLTSSITTLKLNPAFGKVGQNRILWFVMLYLIGAFIKLYPCKFTRNIKFELIAFGGVLLCFIGKAGIGRFKAYTVSFSLYGDFSLAFAVILFLIFKNIKMGNLKVCNVVASCMIGVYLFHDNPFVRKILWKKILDMPKYINSWTMIFRVMMVVLVLMAMGIVIEIIRQKIFAPVFTKIGRKYVLPYYEKICNKLEE